MILPFPIAIVSLSGGLSYKASTVVIYNSTGITFGKMSCKLQLYKLYKIGRWLEFVRSYPPSPLLELSLDQLADLLVHGDVGDGPLARH